VALKRNRRFLGAEAPRNDKDKGFAMAHLKVRPFKTTIEIYFFHILLGLNARLRRLTPGRLSRCPCDANDAAYGPGNHQKQTSASAALNRRWCKSATTPNLVQLRQRPVVGD